MWDFSFVHMEIMPLPSLPLIIDPFSFVLVFLRQGTGWPRGTCSTSSPILLWASAGHRSQPLSGCCVTVEDAQVPNTQSRAIWKGWDIALGSCKGMPSSRAGEKAPCPWCREQVSALGNNARDCSVVAESTKKSWAHLQGWCSARMLCHCWSNTWQHEKSSLIMVVNQPEFRLLRQHVVQISVRRWTCAVVPGGWELLGGCSG